MSQKVEVAELRLEQLCEQRAARIRIDAMDQTAHARLRRLLCCCAFLAQHLWHHPEDLELCADPRYDEDMEARIQSCGDAAALRRCKYRSLLCISLLDLDGTWDTAQVLHTLNTLAEHILRRALALACTDPDLPRPCVLGLGKLGAGEINFSSDVDLIFVMQDDESLSAPLMQERIAAQITCLQQFASLLSQRTASGFLYRVDLRLRPWGDAGPLLMPVDAMENYYAASSDAWERIAMLRARPLAGDLEPGLELLRRLHPFLYMRSLSSSDLQRLGCIKQDMARQHERCGHWNVKTGAGGIRDIEFFVHILQLLHGFGHEALRTTSTLGALQALPQAGLAGPQEADEITQAYLYLRRLENHLQMVDERQNHSLSSDPGERMSLACSLAPADMPPAQALEQMEEQLSASRSIAQNCFERVLPGDMEWSE